MITVPTVSAVPMVPMVSRTILDSTFQLLLRSRTSAYPRIGMRRVIGFKTIGTIGTFGTIETGFLIWR
jgi:hypothetical protein